MMRRFACVCGTAAEHGTPATPRNNKSHDSGGVVSQHNHHNTLQHYYYTTTTGTLEVCSSSIGYVSSSKVPKIVGWING